MEKKEPTGGPHFVGTREELIAAKRSFRTLEGRDILVVYHQGVFYALDFHCYHAGSPLQNGDIEDFDGKLCIVCPKHKFKISLAQGESIYKIISRTEGPPKPRWLSKGIKQRVHTISETNGDVYIKLSEVDGFVESDYYQGEEGKAKRAAAAAAMADEEDEEEEES